MINFGEIINNNVFNPEDYEVDDEFWNGDWS